MDINQVVRALARAEDLPREAVLAAAAHRAQLVPIFLGMVDDYVAGKLPRGDFQTLFYAFYLFGQWRETAAYRPLCRFLRMPRDDVDEILGVTTVTEDSHRVMAAVFDGDATPLCEVIHDTRADEFVRSMMCIALAMVTARGLVPRSDTETFLREAFDKLRPRIGCYVWSGWQEAVARLGLADLRPLVETAFRRGSVEREWLDIRHFDEDLNQALADGCAAIAGGDSHYSLFSDDAIAEFSTWHGFSEEGRQESARAKQKAALAALEPSPPADKITGLDESFAGASQKAPCPCGSGRKFKHCHGR